MPDQTNKDVPVKEPAPLETSSGITIPPEDQGKQPWEMSWGMTQEMMPTPTAPVPKSDIKPWDMDWGITDYLKVVPQAASAAQEGIQNLSFDSVLGKLVNAESGGKHTDASGNLLQSSAGAQGITQVMRKTGADPGYGVQPLQNQSKEEYLRFGSDYLRAMLKNFGGDYRKAVAAYNAGPGSVEKAVKMASNKGGDWTQYLPKKEETIPYMNKILGGDNNA